MAADQPRRVKGVRWITVLVLIVVLLATVAAAFAAHRVVNDQEHRLLKERAAEAGLFVSNAFGSLQTSLASLGTVATLSGGDPAVFTRLAAQQGGTGAQSQPAALVDATPTGLVVGASTLSALKPGDLVSGSRAKAMQAALREPGLVSTTVLSQGTSSVVGFALGPPKTPQGTVVYTEFSIPHTAGSTGATATAFSELAVALYVTPQADPQQLLLATSGRVDLEGSIVHTAVPIGNSHWLLLVSARRPLVGSLANEIVWLVLGAGLIAGLLLATVVDTIVQRRDYALGLVDERTAELRTSLADLEAAQSQLVHQERLAAVGQLASTVGHELRNPLGVITNSLYLIRGATADTADDRLRRQLATAEREVAAATLIVSDLLDYARNRAPILGSVDLPGLIDEALDVVPPPAGVAVDWQHPEQVAAVSGDRDQLRQILLNLISNAYDAMAGGGVLHLEVRDRDKWIEVLVGDNGIGMDPQTKARLYEPFFTTKAKGTGLGLAVTERLVTAHRGRLAVDSEPGRGTTFTVALPAAISAAEVLDVPAAGTVR